MGISQAAALQARSQVRRRLQVFRLASEAEGTSEPSHTPSMPDVEEVNMFRCCLEQRNMWVYVLNLHCKKYLY